MAHASMIVHFEAPNAWAMWGSAAQHTQMRIMLQVWYSHVVKPSIVQISSHFTLMLPTK